MTVTHIGDHQGRPVHEGRLRDGDTEIAVMSYGAVIRDWRVGGVPCVLGFPGFAPYPEHSRSFGILAGRVANRTAHGRFDLDGVAHQLDLTPGQKGHSLHGGAVGLGRRMWDMEAEGEALVLRYDSPDGEEGHPGRVLFEVRMRLEGPRLVMEMTGTPDRPTPINLAQHNYYNLAGAGDVLDHVVRIAASGVTPVDETLIPAGQIEPVAGTRFDFRTPRTVADADPERAGHDHNLVLETGDPAAAVWCPRSGLRLRIWTDQPGLQLYTAAGLDVAAPGHDGVRYGAYAGLCLEAQHFPDSLNKPHWPSIVATPEAPYRQRLALEIAPADGVDGA